MNTTKTATHTLKKVSLSIEAGTGDQDMDLTPNPVHLEFIFGLGTKGLTAFEHSLADLNPDDQITLKVDPQNLHAYFEHIPMPSFILPKQSEEIYLRVHINAVEPADQREVVKALAAIADCGDSSCGH